MVTMPFKSIRLIQKGFTIVEILVVVTILMILSGFLVTVVNPTLVKNRSLDARMLKVMTELVEAIETYRAVEESYPVDTDGDGNPINDTAALAAYISTWPDGNPTGAIYTYNYNAGTSQFGLISVKNDGRIYKYRSDISWGKVVRECAGTAVVTDTNCP